MKAHRLSLVVLAGVMAAMLTMPGCGEAVKTGPLVEMTRTVDLGDAESLRAEIQIAAGKLEIQGGGPELLNADFIYNVEEWKPVIEYSTTGKRGHLVVRQPHDAGYRLGRNVKYEWDLRLNDEVPTDMSVEVGAGESSLLLGTMSLESLKVSTGAGTVALDLRGSRNLTELDVKTGAGSVMVDLSGDWYHDLEADISGGIGQVTLRLPSQVGVRVEAAKGIGKIRASGLRRDGKAYVNAAYGKSDVTLEIDVKTGLGAIELELEGPGAGVTI